MEYMSSITKIWCVTLHQVWPPFEFFILFYFYFSKPKCGGKWNPTFKKDEKPNKLTFEWFYDCLFNSQRDYRKALYILCLYA